MRHVETYSDLVLLEHDMAFQTDTDQGINMRTHRNILRIINFIEDFGSVTKSGPHFPQEFVMLGLDEREFNKTIATPVGTEDLIITNRTTEQGSADVRESTLFMPLLTT